MKRRKAKAVDRLPNFVPGARSSSSRWARERSVRGQRPEGRGQGDGQDRAGMEGEGRGGEGMEWKGEGRGKRRESAGGPQELTIRAARARSRNCSVRVRLRFGGRSPSDGHEARDGVSEHFREGVKQLRRAGASAAKSGRYRTMPAQVPAIVRGRGRASELSSAPPGALCSREGQCGATAELRRVHSAVLY
ncbi:hypothetical protein AXG93_3988s1010 [Marchantia polymorpha subsp. ruderalis]|uniref:Uncharacterized protein n=1 Tax=Marchantia polymorpha subsp. ruderalis TaxID=1480154 RepID=A0A176VPI0_MARPO|nr:hypothetical protein AXG93_3988s1010 [Marchantia polymorpha subsp. ruderalis]